MFAACVGSVNFLLEKSREIRLYIKQIEECNCYVLPSTSVQKKIECSFERTAATYKNRWRRNPEDSLNYFRPENV